MKMKLSLFIFAVVLVPFQGYALNIKEMVTISGVQENEISGTGIVTGLLGTGDKKNPQKTKMIINILHNNDLDLSKNVEEIDTKNSALVAVTGKIPPFASKGQPITLNVSAIGDSKSLKDGSLLFTKLTYPDPNSPGNEITFATVQGKLVQSEGTPLTSGTVQGIIQDEVPSTLVRGGKIRLLMRKPDFVDADRIKRQINQKFFKHTNGEKIAHAASAGLIEVKIPTKFKDNPVGFIAEVEKIPVLFKDISAKVRINTKSGMVTFNEKVEVSPFAFSYKDLNVVVKGEPKRAPNQNSKFVHMVEKDNPQKTDLKTLVDALNDMRVKPNELVEIIQEVHNIGALHAELIIE